MWKTISIISSIVMLLGPVSAFSGEVGIDWENNQPMTYVDPPGVTNDIGDRDTFAQLLWTEDTNTYWTPGHMEFSVNDTNGTLYGTDGYTAYLLNSTIIPAANYGSFDMGTTVYSNSNVGGNNILSGWIYSIIYSDTNLNYLTTWYFISQFVSANQQWTPPPAPPNPVTMDITAGATPDGNGFVHMEFQLVPEPVSLSLYTLGVITLFAVSRRKRS